MPKLRSTYEFLRQTSNLQNILRRAQGTIHLQTCKIVRDSVRKLAYTIFLKEILALFKSISYVDLTINLR